MDGLDTTQSRADEASRAPILSRLTRLIAAYAPHDGSFELRVPGVYAIRRSRTHKDLAHVVQRPALCLVAQGAKSVLVGRDVYEYDPSHLIVFSVDMPVAAQVTRATPAEPYLGFRLDLDPKTLSRLVLSVYPNGLPAVRDSRAIHVSQASPGILNAAARLLELIAEPRDAELIAPLVIDEIIIRLLRSPIGVRVAQIGVADSGVQAVAKAVSWLCTNFSRPVRVYELARLANMSPSSFHRHFKSVTSMSPLRYQKVLRLQEARRLMLSPDMDAGTASRNVGYLSASQFSREYGRFFGNPPAKDVLRLREQVGVAVHE